MTTTHEHIAENGWQRFWNRGGWWKALLLTVAYAALYEGFGLLDGTVFGGLVNKENIFADPQSVFFGLAFPILLGGLALLVFVATLKWLGEIFGPQPIRGSWWMWIVVVLLIIPIALHLAATNWGAYPVGVILVTLLTGVFVGFAEELLTRGLAVNLLRRAGYGEKAVMLLSSALFAILHSVNLLTGQPLVNVAVTVAYTFGFGVMMYLVLRVTDSIIWPMLIHAATDPTTILATGGVDVHTETAGAAGLLSLAGVFNFVYIAVAILAIFLVKGKVFPDRTPGLKKAPELA